MKHSGTVLQKTNKRNWSYVTTSGATSPTNYHQVLPTSPLGQTLKIIARNGYGVTFRYW